MLTPSFHYFYDSRHNVLARVLQLYDKYIDFLIKALPGHADEDGLPELQDHTILTRAETDSEQLALLGAAFTILDELLPKSLVKVWKLEVENGGGDGGDSSSSPSLISSSAPELKEWKRHMVQAFDKLRNYFCLQFVLSFIYSREGLTRLDALIYLTETPDDLHLPSLPFQALFSKLQQLAIIAGDVLLGKEKLQKILLARLTETVIIWLSNEQEFWSAFEDESTPLQPSGLQQLILDMNFTVEIARFAGYPFKVVQNHASVVINRAINIFSSRGINPQRKVLPCGLHTCNEVCHSGDCPPCLVKVNQKCRCGSSFRTVECYFTTSSETEKFVCAKSCGRKKNCGRHRCSERCCPLLNSKKNDLSGDWDPHACQLPCGKNLRCGQHSCESSCHSGHCPPCLEMIFTDLTCACGRTSIPPPLPCGTPVPSCQLPCSIPQPCGHSATHGCHFGDCPPCSAPVEKKCVGGHVVLRNIPCGLKDIRCNKICGKTRRCGLHACARTCHPEPCDSYNESEAVSRVTCGQTCGAPRRDCRHVCVALCHPSLPCPDSRCEFSVTITCSCGRITATVPCDAGGESASNDSVSETSVLRKLPTPLQPVDMSGNRIPLGQRKLSCDDECAKQERKKLLQDAFDITPPNLDSLHFSENSAMTEIISDIYRRDPKWVLAVEERFKFLVLGKARGSTSALKVHVFCPMQKDKLDTVRLLAERWKLAVSNGGWEPKKFIVVHVTQKSKPPARIIGARSGAVSVGGPHPPSFDPLVDMDPRLVVSLLDLPREANVSAVVLRFGGECELVWLNDKNAFAVFHDPARAATAMRRLDHGSVYNGAVVVQSAAQSPSLGNNAWGKLPSSSSWDVQKENPWKKAVIQESDDSWGADDSPIGGSSTDIQASAWRSATSNAPIVTSANRWSVLEPEKPKTSTLEPLVQSGESSSSEAAGKQLVEGSGEEVVDDWEKVCE
ncbi:hypothetical protein F2Q68_00040585 [Brassica cretica]|uniref:NF-X1-type domain-containing protein n=1 Tax=Brassica cretica TaxID=69181 RepID=A0A8S9MF32_BRACR|nr:hypothetical protein F2Q68_00040585 [Brassica cretica]